MTNLPFNTIIDGLPEGVLVCNTLYEIVYINSYALKALGINKKEIIGKKLPEIITNISEQACEFCQLEPISSDGLIGDPHQALISDTHNKDILVKTSHSVVGEGQYIVTTFSPLTNIICHDKAQMDFVSTVSHELRTPMTSIKGFADTLLNAGDRLDKEQQLRFLGIIKSQADRLTRLVEDLLTVSRLETKKNKSIFRSLDLRYYIDMVVFSLKSKHPDHKFIVDMPKEFPKVWADQDKLEQILTNLIDNACKYSEAGTKVTIKVLFAPDDHDKILINIIDEGIGIPKEHVPKIFNKFSRLDNPLTRQVQGTGLGLYITKALTENMGGTISLASSEKGTIFSVKLLVATPERQAKQGLVGS